MSGGAEGTRGGWALLDEGGEPWRWLRYEGVVL